MDNRLVVIHAIDKCVQSYLVGKLPIAANNKGYSNFTFAALLDCIPETLQGDWIDRNGNICIRAKALEECYGIIWEPTVMHRNWFEELKDQGYNGKRILLYTAQLNLDGFRRSATATIMLPSINKPLEDKVLMALL